MPTIQWDDSYSVNHHELDEQHRQWIAIFNEIHSTMLYGKPDELHVAGRKALLEMMDYAKFHFCFEEKYMKSIGYPAIVEHIRLHERLDNLIYKYCHDIEDNNRLVLNTDIMKIIKKWLMNHILYEDQKYCDFVKSQESG